MFKEYAIKDPAIRGAFLKKIAVRVASDATIPRNRLIEKDASTGDIELASLRSLRVIGANQDSARADGDYFYAEQGTVYVEASTPLVAGMKVKASTDGFVAPYIDTLLAESEIAESTGGAFTNQPTTDGITVVSASADDITQTVTVYGVDSSGDYITEDFVLAGDTDVDSVSEDWAVVCGVIIDEATLGDIEVSETSGGAEIHTLAAGEISAGIDTVVDGYAYDAIATVEADGASTAKVIVVHEATNGASSTPMVATLNGTTAVDLSVASYKITKVMVGAVDAVVTTKTTSSVDAIGTLLGNVLVGASEGEYAIVNMR